MIAKVTQKLKFFLNPQTQQQTFNRIAGTLIGCICVLFMALLLSRWIDAHSSIYISDGDSVLKINADNTYTVYRQVY